MTVSPSERAWAIRRLEAHYDRVNGISDDSTEEATEAVDFLMSIGWGPLVVREDSTS